MNLKTSRVVSCYLRVTIDYALKSDLRYNWTPFGARVYLHNGIVRSVATANVSMLTKYCIYAPCSSLSLSGYNVRRSGLMVVSLRTLDVRT